jgi:hypothetical protein
MVDKGMEIPPDLLVPPHRPASDLRRGLVLVGGGIGLLVLLITFPDGDLRDVLILCLAMAALAFWSIFTVAE